MSKIKVFIVAESEFGDHAYTNMFIDFVREKEMKNADLVIFTGGEDVYPLLYRQKSLKETNFKTKRDYFELTMFQQALTLKKPMLGICRGSQFLTVMSGGQLIQHVNGHSGSHDITLLYDPTSKSNDELHMKVTSTHHQMMCPMISELSPSDYTILGWSKSPLSSQYLIAEDGETKDISGRLLNYAKENGQEEIMEPEMVYYHNTNCLCMQFHPEYFDFKSMEAFNGEKSLNIVKKFINDYLLETNVKNKINA